MASIDPNLTKDENIGLSRYAGVADPFDRCGYNPAITTAEESIWSNAGVYAFPSSAVAMTIVSSDANDAAAGTGARTVMVRGLTAAFSIVEQTVTLNGATPVAITTSLFRVLDVVVLTAGSGGVNAGNLTVANSGTTYGYVTAGQNVSQTITYTVPAGRTLVVKSLNLTAGSTDVFTFRLRSRESGGVFYRSKAYVAQGAGPLTVEFDVPLVFPAGTDVDVTAIAVSGTQICAASMNGFLYRG